MFSEGFQFIIVGRIMVELYGGHNVWTVSTHLDGVGSRGYSQNHKQYYPQSPAPSGCLTSIKPYLLKVSSIQIQAASCRPRIQGLSLGNTLDSR